MLAHRAASQRQRRQHWKLSSTIHPALRAITCWASSRQINTITRARLRLSQKALKIAPNSVKTHNNIGNAYVAMKDLDSLRGLSASGLHLDPANQDSNYDLGVLLMMEGKAAEAVPHFQKVTAKNLAARFNLIRAYFEGKRASRWSSSGDRSFNARGERCSGAFFSWHVAGFRETVQTRPA